MTDSDAYDKCLAAMYGLHRFGIKLGLDIIGELNAAGEKRGLKMGIYYSFMEWHHPLWMSDRERFATEWMHPKFKEVVERYKPWHIFLDGEWLMHHEGWAAEELAYWLYEESSVKAL